METGGVNQLEGAVAAWYEALGGVTAAQMRAHADSELGFLLEACWRIPQIKNRALTAAVERRLAEHLRETAMLVLVGGNGPAFHRQALQIVESAGLTTADVGIADIAINAPTSRTLSAGFSSAGADPNTSPDSTDIRLHGMLVLASVFATGGQNRALDSGELAAAIERIAVPSLPRLDATARRAAGSVEVHAAEAGYAFTAASVVSPRIPRHDERANETVGKMWRLLHSPVLTELIGHLRTATATQPDIADLHYLLGVLLQLEGNDPIDALTCYGRALALGIDDFWVHLNRAKGLHDTGHTAQAVVALAQARARDPEHPELFHQVRRETIGELWDLFYRAAPDELVARLHDAMREHPLDGELYFLAGLALHAAEDRNTEALKYYDRAIELGFDSHCVRLQRGKLLCALERRQEGAFDLRLAREFELGHAEPDPALAQSNNPNGRHSKEQDATAPRLTHLDATTSTTATEDLVHYDQPAEPAVQLVRGGPLQRRGRTIEPNAEPDRAVAALLDGPAALRVTSSEKELAVREARERRRNGNVFAAARDLAGRYPHLPDLVATGGGFRGDERR